MREIASRLLLFGMSMCVCVLIVEGCIRLFNIEETHFYQMHPVTGWALVPDRTGWRETPNNRVWININSKGLRDRDYVMFSLTESLIMAFSAEASRQINQYFDLFLR